MDELKKKKKSDLPPPIILATSQSRFCDKNIPFWLSYAIAFLTFPLNMMLMGLGFFIYGLCFSPNIYLRTFMGIYAIWLIFIDRKRCDGVGYPCHTVPFNYLRHWVRNNLLYAMHCAYYPIKLHKLGDLPTTTKDQHGNKQRYLSLPVIPTE